MNEHEKVDKYGHTRFCDAHGCHGVLYNCEEYSEETQNEIDALVDRFKEACDKGNVVFNLECLTTHNG